MKQKAQIHDLDMLPVYLGLSEGQFRSSFEQLQQLENCEDHPYILDDETIQRIINVYVEQKEYNELTLNQCRHWRTQNPSSEQIEDIEIVEGFTKKLQEVNSKIVRLANNYKQQTIERLLEKDPIESAIDFMLGKTPMSYGRKLCLGSSGDSLFFVLLGNSINEINPRYHFRNTMRSF